MLGLTCLLSACQFSSHAHQGQFKLNIAWPTGFRTQAIPADTATLRLRIAAEENILVNESIDRSGETVQRSYTLNIGTKNLSVEAFDTSGTLLASGQTQVNILPAQTTRAELELQPVATPTPSPAASVPGSNSAPSVPGEAPLSPLQKHLTRLPLIFLKHQQQHPHLHLPQRLRPVLNPTEVFPLVAVAATIAPRVFH